MCAKPAAAGNYTGRMKRRDFLNISSGMMAITALASRRLVTGPAKIDAAWYRRSRRFAELPVSRVAYVERGRGPAALFIHGYPLNGFQWRGGVARAARAPPGLWPPRIGVGFP